MGLGPRRGHSARPAPTPGGSYAHHLFLWMLS